MLEVADRAPVDLRHDTEELHVQLHRLAHQGTSEP
jgi:hypothetical protein